MLMKERCEEMYFGGRLGVIIFYFQGSQQQLFVRAVWLKERESGGLGMQFFVVFGDKKN